MAPQAWFIGPVCGVDNCRSRRYVTRDGLTICQLGHVADGNIELNNEEEDMGGPITRRLNVVNVDSHGAYMSQSKTQSQGLSTLKNHKLHGKDAFDLYLKCLQLLLKAEYEIFIELFFGEECPDLLLIVKTNWIKILEKAFADYDKKHTSTQNSNRAAKMPSLLDIIALLYLSTLQLRYKPVYLSDIIPKLQNNTIPFVRTLHLLPDKYLVQLLTVYQILLQPPKVLIPGALDNSIRSMANILYQNDIKIHINYYYPYIFTTLKHQLKFPNLIDLFNFTVEFCDLLEYTPTLILNKSNSKDIVGSQEFPEIKIASILVFVIKTSFIFKISDSKRVNPILWLKYFDKFEKANNPNFYTKVTDKDILNWSDDQTQEYFDWIHNEIAPKKNITTNGFDDKLSTMEKQLFKIFDYDTVLDPIDRKNMISPAPEIETFNEDDALTNMVDPKNHVGKVKITPSVIKQVESKVIEKMSEVLGIESALLLASYKSTEKDIRDKLILSKPK